MSTDPKPDDETEPPLPAEAPATASPVDAVSQADCTDVVTTIRTTGSDVTVSVVVDNAVGHTEVTVHSDATTTTTTTTIKPAKPPVRMACVSHSSKITCLKEAKDFYRIKLAGVRNITVKDIPVRIFFDPAVTHLYSRSLDAGEVVPPDELVERTGEVTERRRFALERALFLTDVLPAIWHHELAVFGTEETHGHKKIVLFGPVLTSGEHMLVALSPMPKKGTFYCVSAYPVKASKKNRAHAEGVATNFPPL